jgi:hypothetical protein
LLEAGVPVDRLIPEQLGTDTLSQIRNCVTILKELDSTMDDVWIATEFLPSSAMLAAMGIKTHIVPALADRPELPFRKSLYLLAARSFRAAI